MALLYHHFICLFFLLIFLHIKPKFSSAQNDEKYTNCKQPFQCGDFTANFPFWGEKSRPSYCGHPNFELKCANNDIPTIQISKQNYKVLKINQENPFLDIVPMYILDEICPNNSSNNNNNNNNFLPFFEFTSATTDLTLFSDCTILNSLMSGSYHKFNCFSLPNHDPHEFYVFQPISNANIGVCKDNVQVPVQIPTDVNEFLKDLSDKEVDDVLKNGFQVRWIINDTWCGKCRDSGGECGYNSNDFSLPVCYCSDRPHETNCPSPNSNAVPSSSGEYTYPVTIIILY